jgi:hypothetical protein
VPSSRDGPSRMTTYSNQPLPPLLLQAKRLYLHGEGKLLPPMPSSFAKEMEEDSPTVVLRRLKDNTFPDEPTLTGKTTLTSEPTATSIGSSRRGYSRFSYQGSSAAANAARATVTNFAAPTATTLTNLAAPTATNISSTGSKVTLPTRFRPANYDFAAEKQAAHEAHENMIIYGHPFNPYKSARLPRPVVPSAAETTTFAPKTSRDRFPVPVRAYLKCSSLSPATDRLTEQADLPVRTT